MVTGKLTLISKKLDNLENLDKLKYLENFKITPKIKDSSTSKINDVEKI